MPHNIERSAFRKGQYTGYGNGFVWRIRREGKQWLAACSVGCAYGRTLADLSSAISDPANSCT